MAHEEPGDHRRVEALPRHLVRGRVRVRVRVGVRARVRVRVRVRGRVRLLRGRSCRWPAERRAT